MRDARPSGLNGRESRCQATVYLQVFVPQRVVIAVTHLVAHGNSRPVDADTYGDLLVLEEWLGMLRTLAINRRRCLVGLLLLAVVFFLPEIYFFGVEILEGLK